MADDFNQRAAKGQAYNLAVATAIADGKQHDNQYIAKQYLRHLQFANLMQKTKPAELAAAVEEEAVIAKIKELDEMLER